MGETTIGWTATVHNGQVYPGYTFNPWIGCTKVSPGCAHCYAERDNNFHKWVNGWGPSAPRKRTSESNWKNPLKWNRAAHATGIPRKVFVASLADIAEDHPSILPQWRADLAEIIHRCQWLYFLLLTKRPENFMPMYEPCFGKELPPNVWMGTTAENQEMAYKRIPELLKIPAAIRFLSVEPMLGPVDIQPYLFARPGCGGEKADPDCEMCKSATYRIDWVICGGESGPAARPMSTDWALDLRDQCQVANVPFFFKQIGGTARIDGHWGGDRLAGQRYQEFPE